MSLVRAFLILLVAVAAVVGAAAQTASQDPPPRPNFLVILVDDAGFSDFAAFGGETSTPAIDALAARGARLANHHASPLCSPSRAMLLTGLDNHRTGVATIAEVLPPAHRGRPGYGLSFAPGVETVAARLKAAGYRTLMAGKWHLGSGPGDLPNAHGFDRSLALDASGADNWAPKPYMPYYTNAPWYEDGAPAAMPAQFYSSDLLADRLISYIDEAAAPQPFFAYLSFQALHIPVQAPRVFSDRARGRYDAGWEAVRQARHARAQALGLIPADAPYAPIPDDLPAWEDLTQDERALAARSMEVYAGMVEAMDAAIGRVLAHLAANGLAENTVVILTSDNGPEPSDPVHAPGMNIWMATQGYSYRLKDLGEANSLNYVGPAWAWASAAPGQLTKFTTAEGGVRVPLVIAGPGFPQGQIHTTPTFITDIAPTMLELAGVAPPGDLDGRSLGPLLRGETSRAHPENAAIGMEVSGAAALYQGDLKITRLPPPWGDGQWRLYDITADPAETQDLSAARPAEFAALQAAYGAYAERVGVLETPPGYTMTAQVGANALAVQLKRYGWAAGVLALALLGGLVFIFRARSRKP